MPSTGRGSDGRRRKARRRCAERAGWALLSLHGCTTGRKYERGCVSSSLLHSCATDVPLMSKYVSFSLGKEAIAVIVCALLRGLCVAFARDCVFNRMQAVLRN